MFFAQTSIDKFGIGW